MVDRVGLQVPRLGRIEKGMRPIGTPARSPSLAALVTASSGPFLGSLGAGRRIPAVILLGRRDAHLGEPELAGVRQAQLPGARQVPGRG